jgi:hypothetical protein
MYGKKNSSTDIQNDRPADKQKNKDKESLKKTHTHKEKRREII